MEYFTPSVEFMGIAPSDEMEMLQMIEAAGRTCYKSEDKITDDSAVRFFEMILRRGHLSVLEHSNIAFTAKYKEGSSGNLGSPFGYRFHSSIAHYVPRMLSFIQSHSRGVKCSTFSGSLRSWIELYTTANQHLESNEFLWFQSFTLSVVKALRKQYPTIWNIVDSVIPPIPMEYHEELDVHRMQDVEYEFLTAEKQLELLQSNPDSDLPIFVFRVVTDRGISHEIVRHRTLQFSQESTRYVNYSNKGVQFFQIANPNSETFEEDRRDVDHFLRSSEHLYNVLIERGVKPQIARNVLPNSLRTEIVISGRWSNYGANPYGENHVDLSSGWSHFLRMRQSNAAHPYIRYLASKIAEEFYMLGLSL